MNVAELFCGTGGFSHGAHQAGFDVKVAYDLDEILSSSYAKNFPTTKLLRRDVSKLTGHQIKEDAECPIHGVIGGPPCQGFSDIGRRDPGDVRRRLLWHYFRVVSEVEPTFFVMENVRGLLNEQNKAELDKAVAQVSDRYWVMEPQVWDAAQFGAATKRERAFVIGIHKDRADPINPADIKAWERPAATVSEAITDLSGASSLGESDGFDFWKIIHSEKPSSYASGLRAPDLRFTGSQATIHSENVIERFSTVPQGGRDKIGRHPRLAWSGQCPTLRAGTGSDMGSYQSVRPIHPSQDRVITVREAARLQGFPDWHLFHPTIWHSFRMIGNSVSPFAAKAVLSLVASRLAAPLSPPMESAIAAE